MSLLQTKPLVPQTRRWTREEFYRLGEAGYFEGQRVQLIHGEIIQTPAMGHQHVRGVSKCRKAVEAVFGPSHWVREEKPLNVGTDSDPEPDIAVAERPMDAYTDHPTTALLVIEVSDQTLRHDRDKAVLYASAIVREYWILNLTERTLEVYRDPMTASASEPSHYRSRQVLKESETVSPVTCPALRYVCLICCHKPCLFGCNIFWSSSSRSAAAR